MTENQFLNFTPHLVLARHQQSRSGVRVAAFTAVKTKTA
jgi:hypothetical protein